MQNLLFYYRYNKFFNRPKLIHMKILVVDDERDIEILFQQRFRREVREKEIEFVFAYSGEEALHYLNQHVHEAVLILSDINMPGMSGLELLPRAKTARPDVPVIMITAYGDDVTKRKALEGGAEGLLTKPIDFVALRIEIDSRVAGAGAEVR